MLRFVTMEYHQTYPSIAILGQRAAATSPPPKKSNSKQASSSSSSSSSPSSMAALQLRIEDASPDLGFVWRLFLMLRDAPDSFPDVICWCRSGTAFEILDQKKLESDILAKYFNSGKYDSFARNLRGYGFTSVGKRTFAHEAFRRDYPDGCDSIVRVKANKRTTSFFTQAKAKAAARNSPVFSMNPVGIFTSMMDMMSSSTSPSSASVTSASASTSSGYHSEGWSDDDMEPIPFSDAISDLLVPPTSWAHDPIIQGMAMAPGPESLDELEPRRIEEIAASPKYWMSNTPGMTPEVNLIIEYFSPVCLPAVFRYLKLSSVGVACAYAVAIFHTIECMLTDFGGRSWHLGKARLGRVQHAAVDQLVNHSLISALFLLGERHFGQYAIIAGVMMAVSQFLFQLITFKCHFDNFVRVNIQSKSEEIVLEYYLNKFLRDVVVWYASWLTVMSVWYMFGFDVNGTVWAVGVFIFNMVPLMLSTTYWRHFGRRSLSSPSSKVKNA